jgi:glycosyltransferase involved in cell wall biosynthesis
MAEIDFIVPTLRRTDHLRRCLDSILSQSLPIKNIFVGVRRDDHESLLVVSDYGKNYAVVAVDALGVGVIGSMNSCLNRCSSPFIGLVDDDVELPPEWCERLIANLESSPAAVACGGRDLLMDHPEMRKEEPLLLDVGQIKWFGRVSGNHHRGAGNLRAVHVLRGSNILFRREFLAATRFEDRLAGSGAQVNWELALALQAGNQGALLLYDPNCQVIHHVAPRHDADNIHRGGYDWQGTWDIAFNETFVFLTHGKGIRRFAPVVWQLAIGSPTCPGIVRTILDGIKIRPNTLGKLSATFRGRFKAFRVWAEI